MVHRLSRRLRDSHLVVLAATTWRLALLAVLVGWAVVSTMVERRRSAR